MDRFGLDRGLHVNEKGEGLRGGFSREWIRWGRMRWGVETGQFGRYTGPLFCLLLFDFIPNGFHVEMGH